MRLRNLFTDAEVQEAVHAASFNEDTEINYSEMAETLSNIGKGEVSRQLARYWSRQFDYTKKNGDAYLTLTVANRELKRKRDIRPPSQSDLVATVPQEDDPSRILFITDHHAPYHHPDSIHFMHALKQQFKPTMVIHGGDEVDHHALSFHNSDPNLDAAGPELDKARIFMMQLEALFPSLRICESNHGSLAYRRAKAHGIPVQYLKTYREVLFPNGGGEGWSWHGNIRIEMPHGRDLQFQHSQAGDLLKGAAHENANLFVGHEHSKFGIGYGSNAVEVYYSVYGGCMIDKTAMAFAYGALFPFKPIVGAVTVTAGIPQCIPMQVDRYNRWTGVLYG